MIGYIKDRKTFHTLDMMLDLSQYDLILGSVNNNVSTVQVGEELEGLENQFFVADNNIWLIKSLSPDNGHTMITLNDISFMFARDLQWSGSFSSIEQCIANTITKEYINLSDTEYATPYITVSYTTTTSFIAPDVDANNVWNLKAYIAKVRRMKNIFLTYTISKNTLLISIAQKTPNTWKIDFATERAQMVQETYQKTSTAKITVNGATNYYLYTDGTFGTNATAKPRAEGEWVQITTQGSESVTDKVADVFSKNAESRIIEFYTSEDVQFYDTVILRSEGRVSSGTLSVVSISSADNRKYCKTGELIDTVPEAISVLSERIAEVTQTAAAREYIANNFVNRNLLDNAYFIGGGSQNGYGVFPINQRGQASYTSTYTGVDRWKQTTAAGQCSITLRSDCMRMQRTSAGGNPPINQYFATAQAIDKPATFSMLYRTSTNGNTNYFRFRWHDKDGTEYADYSLPNTNGQIHLATLTRTMANGWSSVGFQMMSSTAIGDYIDIIACKFEIGTTQTLAHQENGSWVLNEIPDYREELRKCQAYLVPILGNTVRWSPAQITANIIDVTIPVTVPLAKTQPKVVGTTPTVYYNGTAQTGFTFAFTDRGIEMLNSPAVVLRCTKNSHGLSASGNIMVGASTSTTFASAEP
jgi:hypothetical protein